MDYVVPAVAIMAAGLAGVWLAMRLAPRLTGKTMGEIPPAKRRAFLLMTLLMLILTVVVVWAFISGHPLVAISLLVIFYVLPHFVTVPIRISRSRRRAGEARRRRGSPSAP
jgi:hypothetical protein